MSDHYYDSSSEEIKEEDYQEDADYSSLKTRKPIQQKPIVYALIGVGLVALVMIFVWFWDKPQKTVSAKRMQMLEDKLTQLEKRFIQIKDIDERLTNIENRNQKLGLEVERFDRFESSMSLRMDLIGKELASLQKKTTEPKITSRQPATTPDIGQKKTETTYHTVTAGETLYSISDPTKITTLVTWDSNEIYDAWRASPERAVAMAGAEELWAQPPESERFEVAS